MSALSHRRLRPGQILGAVTICAPLFLAAPHPAAAQQDELKDIERALDEGRSQAEELKRRAADLTLEIRALRADSISAARKAQDHETRLSDLETQTAELERQETEKLDALAARHGQMGFTLAALQRIALQPSDALLLSPSPPLDTLRSGMLLRAAIPAIEGHAAALRVELDDLAALRTQIAARRSQESETTAALTAERKRLSALIGRKSQTRAAAVVDQETARKSAARLAARAKDLRELMEKVGREARANEKAAQRAAAEKARKTVPPKMPAQQAETPKAQERPPGKQAALAQPPNIRPFPSAGQSLIVPARGKMKTRFGQTQDDGRAARGIIIVARDGAQVVAPFDGKVVYAGEFRSYGLILIIEHGGRYHTLLAGLGRVDAVAGQWLLAGEPLGILSGGSGSGPELYLELRHAGQPINPLPWLATTGDKVRG